MSNSFHLALPFVEAAQAQKHVTVNEAIRKLDALLHLSVLTRTLSSPPEEPGEGARYIVGAEAGDAWSGHEGEVAALIDGAWTFFTPRAGWRAFDEEAGVLLLHDSELVPDFGRRQRHFFANGCRYRTDADRGRA
jgi:hypothetical protein